MQQQELETRFNAGELIKAEVIPDFTGSNWNLLVHSKAKAVHYTVTLQRSDEPRVFKTIDAACKVANKIGFIDVSVRFSGLTK